MDDILVPFHRQYLQQVNPTNIRYPLPKYLVVQYVQDQINRYFFDKSRDEYLPPPQYQRRVLKRIITDIERELANGDYDPDEYVCPDVLYKAELVNAMIRLGLTSAISDALMAHMGFLAAIPEVSAVETAQSRRTLSYFLPINALTPSNNHEPDSNEKAIEHRTLIYESPNLLAAGSNVGLRTWEACLYLANYLCTYPGLASRHSNNRGIAGSNIIELGAGTGLLSLICSLHLGAKNVLSTDGLPHVVEGIKANMELNNTTQTLGSNRSFVPLVLDWTDPSSLDQLLDNDDIPFDYILGADVTYHPELHDAFFSIIRRLKDRFPKARVLICATLRNETTQKHLRQVCEQIYGLSVREITDQEWKCPDFRDQTGFFQEQAFRSVIMDIDFADANGRTGRLQHLSRDE